MTTINLVHLRCRVRGHLRSASEHQRRGRSRIPIGKPGETRVQGALSAEASAVKVMNVLIVEDDASVRASIADLLRLQDYNVIEAADGVEGLDLLRRESIDVILLDLRMPRLDGPGVLEALVDPPPVIVLSAFENLNEDDIHERFGTKVFRCLRKPIAPRQLLEAVADALVR